MARQRAVSRAATERAERAEAPDRLHSPTRRRGHGIERGLLDGLLSQAIARANLAGDASYSAMIDDRSITPQRFAMLELVGSNPGLQQKQIADALALSPPAVSITIAYWQARGCIRRHAMPGDRRSCGIFLSDPGHALLEQLRLRVLAHDRLLAAPLSGDERRELGRLLLKISERIPG